MTGMRENDLQNAICEYLTYKHYFFWRSNNIPVFDGQNFRRMPKYSKAGIPDIILIYKGQFIGIEVKLPKGTQSENQKLFEKGCIDAGGTYILAKSLDDIMAIF